MGCADCAGRAPLEAGARAAHASFVIDYVERVRCERASGAAIDLGELPGLVWELVLYYDQIEETFRLAHEARMTGMFEALAQLGRKR